jgi:hypothetical protein
MARPVVIVTSGAPGFVQTTTGTPATPVSANGAPIVLVASGAPGICLVNDDGSLYSAGVGAGVNDRLLENGSHRLTEAGGARLLEI